MAISFFKVRSMSVIVVFIAVFPLNVRNRLSVRAVVAKSLPRSQVGGAAAFKACSFGVDNPPRKLRGKNEAVVASARLFSSSVIRLCATCKLIS